MHRFECVCSGMILLTYKLEMCIDIGLCEIQILYPFKSQEGHYRQISYFTSGYSLLSFRDLDCTLVAVGYQLYLSSEMDKICDNKSVQELQLVTRVSHL